MKGRLTKHWIAFVFMAWYLKHRDSFTSSLSSRNWRPKDFKTVVCPTGDISSLYIGEFGLLPKLIL